MRDSAQAGEGQRERETQNPKQAPGSELSAQSPTWGSNSWTTRSASFFFNVYLFLRDRERQSTSGEGAEREGDTESEAGSWLWAVSTEPDARLELTSREIMT